VTLARSQATWLACTGPWNRRPHLIPTGNIDVVSSTCTTFTAETQFVARPFHRAPGKITSVFVLLKHSFPVACRGISKKETKKARGDLRTLLFASYSIAAGPAGSESNDEVVAGSEDEGETLRGTELVVHKRTMITFLVASLSTEKVGSW
jgi:hypothetical protein